MSQTTPVFMQEIIAPPMAMIKRRIEIIAFERERIVRRPVATLCPVCHLDGELLTTRQAGAIAQVKSASIYRWLASGKAHGLRTAGGRHRICRHSLFRSSQILPSQGVHDEHPQLALSD
jgi:hypothetical protein